jgi:phosphoribosyl 1,2-cyclic phosphodiesterase
MKLKFWGTRGSLPVALTLEQLRGKLADAIVASAGRSFASREDALAFVAQSLPFEVGGGFGGNSSCVEVRTGHEEYLLCDAGSGLRVFGNQVLSARAGKPGVYNLLMSHVHWDHIMGFPFFTPSFIPGNRIVIHGCHPGLREAFERQHGAPSFPVPWKALGAEVTFNLLTPGVTTEIAGARVTPMLQLHEGDSYGYRIEQDGRSCVYSTDSEHKPEDFEQMQAFADFFRDADLVVFDAMYSLADAVSLKEDWGHSSNVVGVELCQMAGAKHLVLFHHEPVFDDARIAATLEETRRFEEITRDDRPVLRVTAAYDGLELDV